MNADIISTVHFMNALNLDYNSSVRPQGFIIGQFKRGSIIYSHNHVTKFSLPTKNNYWQVAVKLINHRTRNSFPVRNKPGYFACLNDPHQLRAVHENFSLIIWCSSFQRRYRYSQNCAVNRENSKSHDTATIQPLYGHFTAIIRRLRPRYGHFTAAQRALYS